MTCIDSIGAQEPPNLDDVFCGRQELLVDAEAVLLYGGPQAPLSLRSGLLIEGGQRTEGPHDLWHLRSGSQDLHAAQHCLSWWR